MLHLRNRLDFASFGFGSDVIQTWQIEMVVRSVEVDDADN